MKLSMIVMTGLVLVGATSLASANPSMLPKQPGYPSAGEYAKDAGQKNLTMEQSLGAAAASEDAHAGQTLVDPNKARLVKPQGAGQLPTFDGATIESEPPVTAGTRMPTQSRHVHARAGMAFTKCHPCTMPELRLALLRHLLYQGGFERLPRGGERE